MDTVAGPSTRIRKPRSAHPWHTTPRTKRLRPAPPPQPAPAASRTETLTPTLPIKVLQGQGVRRTDTSRPGFERNHVFVTRKVGLGALVRRCRTLVVDEGYTSITLYALSAAIPHALLLLHVLLDVLPYPLATAKRGGMRYTIQTRSVECVDEVGAVEEEDDDDEFPGLGAVKASGPEMKVRLKPSVQIELHISPRKQITPSAAAVAAPAPAPTKRTKKQRPGQTDKSAKARPNARTRRARALARLEAGRGVEEDGEEEEDDSMQGEEEEAGWDVSERHASTGSGAQWDVDEEEMMNAFV